MARLLRLLARNQAALVYDENLAGLDVAHHLRAEYVEGARLRRNEVVVAAAAYRERAEAPRVARRYEAVVYEDDEAVRPLDLFERRFERFERHDAGLVRDELKYRLRVAGRLEYRAAVCEICREGARVRQVAVVRERYRPLRVVRAERLAVLGARAARRSVADVAYRGVRLNLRQLVLRQSLVDEAEPLLYVYRPVRRPRDAGGELAPVL